MTKRNVTGNATRSEGYNFLPDFPSDGLKKAEDLITRDLFRLSFHDRNAMDEEIHGVRNISPDETPMLLQTSMHQLSIELAKIKDKPAFNKSQLLFPNDTYVNTLDFRLRFLRCELFDAEKAAIRIVAFLDFMDELFDGDHVLRRPIRFTDLSRAEVKILRSGIYQQLPYRDRSGRPIFAECGNMGVHLDLKMRTKLRFYISYVGSNDTESQRKGGVILIWPEGDFSNTPMPLHESSRLLYKRTIAAVPLRYVAIHLCIPDKLYFRLLMSWFATCIGSKRCRIRFHIVNGVERRYRMKGFGIPVEMIPITDSGNIKRAYLYQWIKVRRIIESKENDNDAYVGSIILLPGSNDVLIRTGTTTLSHPGNVVFRGLIEMKHNEFRLGSEFTQAFLAEHIVEEIERLKGRFLTWDSQGYWTELRDRNQIIFKVEVSIRDFKVKVRARKNMQTINSSTHKFERQDGNGGKRKKTSNNNDVNDSDDTSASDEDPGSCGCGH